MLPSIIAPDRQAQAFPILTPTQIDRIRPYGTARTVRAGEILFEPGEPGISCFVVLSGKLEIVMTRLSGEHVFVTYRSGRFLGRNGHDLRSRLSLARACCRARRIP